MFTIREETTHGGNARSGARQHAALRSKRSHGGSTSEYKHLWVLGRKVCWRRLVCLVRRRMLVLGCTIH